MTNTSYTKVNYICFNYDTKKKQWLSRCSRISWLLECPFWQQLCLGYNKVIWPPGTRRVSSASDQAPQWPALMSLVQQLSSNQFILTGLPLSSNQHSSQQVMKLKLTFSQIETRFSYCFPTYSCSNNLKQH